jgi:hypothetical protein
MRFSSDFVPKEVPIGQIIAEPDHVEQDSRSGPVRRSRL